MILRKTINGKTKTIGQIVDRKLRKSVHKGDHLFRSTPSWAVDLEIWEANKKHVDWLEFHEISENKIYRVSAETFDKRGFIKEFPGHDSQKFLQVKYWDVYDPVAREWIYRYVEVLALDDNQKTLF